MDKIPMKNSAIKVLADKKVALEKGVKYEPIIKTGSDLKTRQSFYNNESIARKDSVTAAKQYLSDKGTTPGALNVKLAGVLGNKAANIQRDKQKNAIGQSESVEMTTMLGDKNKYKRVIKN